MASQRNNPSDELTEDSIGADALNLHQEHPPIDDELADLEDMVLPKDGSPLLCCTCKKELRDKILEEEFGEELYHFCSEKCANKFEHRKV